MSSWGAGRCAWGPCVIVIVGSSAFHASPDLVILLVQPMSLHSVTKVLPCGAPPAPTLLRAASPLGLGFTATALLLGGLQG